MYNKIKSLVAAGVASVKRHGPALAVAGGLLLSGGGAATAHAADYADVAAAVTALEGVPAVVLPVALAFVTLGVGLLTLRFIGRASKKAFSVG